MEVDCFVAPEWREGFVKALNILKTDYLIGSAHFIEYKNILYNSHDVKNATTIEQNMLLYRYWQNERAAAEFGLFNFMAHLDLMKKIGLGQGKEWIEEEQKNGCGSQTCRRFDCCQGFACGISRDKFIKSKGKMIAD